MPEDDEEQPIEQPEDEAQVLAEASLNNTIAALKAEVEGRPEYQLDNAELSKLIKAGKAELLQVLYCKNYGLIQTAVRRYGRNIIELDPAVAAEDLMQSSWESMAAAVTAYKPENGAFSTLALFYLRKGFIECCGRRRNLTNPENKKLYYALLQHDSLDRPITGTDGSETALGDLIADPASNDPIEKAEQRIYNAQLHAELARNIARLPEQQQRIIDGYYFDGRTLPELAATEQCSTAWAATQHNSALQKMKATAFRKTGTFKSRLLEFIDGQTDYLHSTPEKQTIHRDTMKQWALTHPDEFAEETGFTL